LSCESLSFCLMIKMEWGSVHIRRIDPIAGN
jgi:hypothetical protein